ncbi:MAG: hypothetical protein ACRD2Z_03650 [Thermoanaerobaculia bacterium]
MAPPTAVAAAQLDLERRGVVDPGAVRMVGAQAADRVERGFLLVAARLGVGLPVAAGVGLGAAAVGDLAEDPCRVLPARIPAIVGRSAVKAHFRNPAIRVNHP